MKAQIIAQLQQEIHQKEGFTPSANARMNEMLGPLRTAFPTGAFPLGLVHEFLTDVEKPGTSKASTVGFITALASQLMSGRKVMWWISDKRKVFPPALMSFGVRPDQVVFVNIKKARDVLWATEEALKCSAIAVVVAEVGGLDLTASRRLQLSAEQSLATGFLIRNDTRPGITSSASRWRITSMPSFGLDGLPGVGFPQWKVQLLKLRNGRTGQWSICFRNGRFESNDTGLQKLSGVLEGGSGSQEASKSA